MGRTLAVTSYAQAAFRLWAVNGRIPSEELREILRARAIASASPPEIGGRGMSRPTEQALVRADEILAENEAALRDIDAVARTMELFKKNDALTIRCIELVYLIEPERPTRRGEIRDRVIRAAEELHMSPESVYRKIRDAVIWFAQERGISSTEPANLKIFSNF